MALSLTAESKNSLTLTNEAKISSMTWDGATMTWDDATFTWDSVHMLLARESKNALTLTNEAKN